MESNRDADRMLVSKYETVFCVFMAVLAYLWRDNPNIVYPQILYLFILLMSLNIAAGISLRMWPAREWLSAIFILANCGAITGVLAYSGGPESNLWVLYLLPIYTACLLLGLREVIWITIGAIGFNTVFLAREVADWGTGPVFELLLKSGIFIFTAAMTWKIVERDKRSRSKLQSKRSELRVLEEFMQVQKVRLEETEKMAEVGLLSSGVVHDLNGIFMVALGSIEIILQNGSLDAEMTDDLNRIQKSVAMGKNIVANFVGLARKEKPNMAPCDIRKILQSILILLRGPLNQYGIKVRLNFGEDLPMVMASSTHLERLFLNLCSNAIRAMKDGGTLTVKTEELKGKGRPEPRVRMTIEDTGPGIPDAIMAKLFSPFSTTMESQGGTGLGLYVCSEIAMQHGGMLHAENKAGGGARLILSLPASGVKQSTGSVIDGMDLKPRILNPLARVY
ncbi:MAG: HAMP domain-containing sensor histidine kinase [bacterium]